MTNRYLIFAFSFKRMSGKLFQYFLIFIVGLTLNSSVDLPDYLLYQNQVAQSNSNFNEIESFAELICEHALNIHGQFPDKKNDHSGHRHQSKKISSTKFNDKRLAFSFKRFRLTEQKVTVSQPVFFTDYTKDILSPPPRG